ncbi:MAG: DUF4249 family protein [Ignavibacteriales bacterium]|nr:DUF4249 family protein [Ignavibacteriales bacterium]
MKTRFLHIVFVSGLCLCCLSCDESFSPKGPYEPVLVVYSVLSNRKQEQYVRVYSTYDPPRFDPYEVSVETPVRDAFVRITRQSTSIVLHDTVVYRRDTLRYRDGIHVYVGNSPTPEPGQTYSLEVQAPGFPTASSSVTLPAKAIFQFAATAAAAIQNPRFARPIDVGVNISTLTRLFQIQLFVVFEYREGSVVRADSMEVPLSAPDTSLTDAQWPLPAYADRQGIVQRFGGTAYKAIMDRIVYKHSVAVKFVRTTVHVTQVGEPLFNYHNIIGGFNDEFSIRTDQPDYTNIAGGFGLFAAYVLENFHRPYPDNFYYNPEEE